MHRFLPILVILTVAIVFTTYLPLKRTLVYKLGLSGDPTSSCCSESEVVNSSGDFDENASYAIFGSQMIDYPKTSLAQAQSIAFQEDDKPAVLGTTNTDGQEKWIEVSLNEQKVRAWEGSRVVMEFPVSSGKWSPTPAGTFHIWYKTRSQTMEGGSRELRTYYYLPNVPHNMFFYQGYALHGAYWHNNFGQPMSHGCVNEPLANAAEIFEWAGPVVPEGKNAVKASVQNPGTRVFVH